jgi:predicted enzyme related to lactoylglutathione lyase
MVREEVDVGAFTVRSQHTGRLAPERIREFFMKLLRTGNPRARWIGGIMDKSLSSLVFPTSDLAKSKELLSRVLGADPVFDDPHYVGFQVGGLDIGLDPNGKSRGMTGATPFFEVDDIRETVDALTTAGATIVEDVRPVGGGRSVAILADPDGNMIGLSQSS